jgi:hypothetical protein
MVDRHLHILGSMELLLRATQQISFLSLIITHDHLMYPDFNSKGKPHGHRMPSIKG